jgi:hypothetical protein
VALASTNGDWPIRRVVEAGAFVFCGLLSSPMNLILKCLALTLLAYLLHWRGIAGLLTT